MKILVYIPIYKRREITKTCYESLKRTILNAPKGFTFVVVTVCSNNQDAALAQEHGFDVVWCENRPLGRKFNTGLEYALESYNWDYLMQINSDNVLSTDFWDIFTDYFKKKMYFFGIDRVYFYNSETKDMREFQYTLGCGIRFIRRDVIEIAGFIEKVDGTEVFELWEPAINSGLDNNSADNILSRSGRMQYIAQNKQRRPVVTDIKSKVNIHTFDEFRNTKRVSDTHRIQLMRRFPELKQFDEAFGERKEIVNYT